MLNQLESRLENANSIQMKEKYETDIKKEIKKLQRHRDLFKQLIKDSEIKDKSKMQEARRRVEDQMEKFRDLEKEYKLRKLTKVVFQNHSELENKYKFDSSDSDGSNHRDYSGDYGSSDSDHDSLQEDEPEKPPQETIITVVPTEP
jgi:inorganic triphosphatase YgiF